MNLKVGDYIIQEKIGEGAFAKVHLAYHITTNEIVAIKILPRNRIKGKLLAGFKNEITVLRGVKNQNILKLFQVQKTKNHLYIMMEFCKDKDLDFYVKEKGVLIEEEAIGFLIQILNAFRDLNKYRVMHRDLKPANILLHDKTIKIADFGFSRILEDDNMADTWIGTPLYMAPEVLFGECYDTSVDIWSIGAIFYFMLTGEPPIAAKSMMILKKKLKNYTFSITKTISSLSSGFLSSTLQKDPEDRIQWDDLLRHPINSYYSCKIQREIDRVFLRHKVFGNYSMNSNNSNSEGEKL